MYPERSHSSVAWPGLRASRQKAAKNPNKGEAATKGERPRKEEPPDRNEHRPAGRKRLACRARWRRHPLSRTTTAIWMAGYIRRTPSRLAGPLALIPLYPSPRSALLTINYEMRYMSPAYRNARANAVKTSHGPKRKRQEFATVPFEMAPARPPARCNTRTRACRCGPRWRTRRAAIGRGDVTITTHLPAGKEQEELRQKPRPPREQASPRLAGWLASSPFWRLLRPEVHWLGQPPLPSSAVAQHAAMCSRTGPWRNKRQAGLRCDSRMPWAALCPLEKRKENEPPTEDPCLASASVQDRGQRGGRGGRLKSRLLVLGNDRLYA